MSAGPSRSRVTRLELTADQLLGADLTPARSPRSKNAPIAITVEQLLGSSLTVAGPATRTRSTSIPLAPRPPPRNPPRSASPRSAAAPNRNRVTADEVLRTGLPVRTLQAAKARARSGQEVTLTTQQLLSSGSGSSTGSRLATRRSTPSIPRAIAAEDLAGPSLVTSSRTSRRPSTAHHNTSGASSSAVQSPSNIGSVRSTRSSAAGAAPASRRPSDSSNATATATATATAGGSGGGRGRDSRPNQVQRSNSLGSTRTLPLYTKEPGESEVVIDRGAADLEDEIPIVVMTPVDEDFADVLPEPVPVPTDHFRPAQPAPIPIPIPGRITGSPASPAVPYPDDVPSYEAAMSMSTPDLLAHPATTPLPISPTVSVPGTPVAQSPSSPSSPIFGPRSRPGSAGPPSPTDGAESPRRRFGFMSLFHAHSRSSSRSRLRGGSLSGLPSTVASTAPDPASPGLSVSLAPASPTRPSHRSSHSVSGPMSDLVSRSWSDNPEMARSRSDAGPRGG